MKPPPCISELRFLVFLTLPIIVTCIYTLNHIFYSLQDIDCKFLRGHFQIYATVNHKTSELSTFNLISCSGNWHFHMLFKKGNFYEKMSFLVKKFMNPLNIFLFQKPYLITHLLFGHSKSSIDLTCDNCTYQ